MKRKRLFIDRKTNSKQRKKLVEQAAKNGCEAVVLPLGEKINLNSEYIALAKQYSLFIEAGGCLSLLLPRRLFFFHRGLFRMEHGRRKLFHHFCPTNHKTTAVIQQQAQRLFEQSMPAVTVPRVFHLFPDKLPPGQRQETFWCACPACRAFSPAEQNIIAVSSAALVLAKLDPNAKVSFLDIDGGPDSVSPAGGDKSGRRASVTPRENMFALKDR